jgi:hypothetical protein
MVLLPLSILGLVLTTFQSLDIKMTLDFHQSCFFDEVLLLSITADLR